MWELNAKCLKIYKTGYILTIPKGLNYSGYKTFIPKRFVCRKETFRIIDLPDCQFLNLKNEKETVKVRISDIKRRRLNR
jgi:hypothetical protein